MNKFDVIIIGGGIIGSSIAYELAKRSKKVLLLERGRLASEASGAAAGMLAALVEMGLEVGPLFRLALKSRQMYPKLAHELRALSGIDIGFVDKGMLKVPLTGAEALEFEEIIKLQGSLGHQVSWCEKAHSKEPNLGQHISKVMEVLEDGQVDAPSLSLAFAKSAEALGTTTKEFTQVDDLLIEDGKLVGVKTLTENFRSDQVVVAAGAWSKNLLESHGYPLKTYPVKGECFSVLASQQLLESTVFSHGCYIVPKKGNRLLVGATAIPHTSDKKVSFQSVQSLMEKAKKLLPAIAETEWEKAWSGIRPQTDDGLPYLGMHPVYENLAIATGHYRNGILLSAVTGKLIADLLDGIENEDLHAFRLDRHTS